MRISAAATFALPALRGESKEVREARGEHRVDQHAGSKRDRGASAPQAAPAIEDGFAARRADRVEDAPLINDGLRTEASTREHKEPDSRDAGGLELSRELDEATPSGLEPAPREPETSAPREASADHGQKLAEAYHQHGDGSCPFCRPEPAASLGVM